MRPRWPAAELGAAAQRLADVRALHHRGRRGQDQHQVGQHPRHHQQHQADRAQHADDQRDAQQRRPAPDQSFGDGAATVPALGQRTRAGRRHARHDHSAHRGNDQSRQRGDDDRRRHGGAALQDVLQPGRLGVRPQIARYGQHQQAHTVGQCGGQERGQAQRCRAPADDGDGHAQEIAHPQRAQRDRSRLIRGQPPGRPGSGRGYPGKLTPPPFRGTSRARSPRQGRRRCCVDGSLGKLAHCRRPSGAPRALGRPVKAAGAAVLMVHSASSLTAAALPGHLARSVAPSRPPALLC